MSGIIGSAVLLGLQGLLELVVPKLIELGADELEKADLEGVVRSIVPGDRLDDMVVRIIKENLPKLIAGIREHTGDDAVSRIVDSINK